MRVAPRWGDYAAGLLLGAGAVALNRWLAPPLLSEETPQFLFGTALVLFGFLRFGEGPGLVAAIVQSLGLAPTVVSTGGTAIVVVVSTVPLVEAWSIFRLHRRLQSPMVAAVVFWFGFGWLIDLVGYGVFGGLPLGYLGILSVKQLINGAINALVAELAWRLLPDPARRSARLQAVPVRSLVRARLFLFAVPPMVVLGLLYVRASFEGVIQQVQVAQQRQATRVAAEIHRALDSTQVELDQLAARVEHLDRPDSVAAALAGFRRAHPEYPSLLVTDSTSRVTAVASEPGNDGVPQVGAELGSWPGVEGARRSGFPTTTSPRVDSAAGARNQRGQVTRTVPLLSTGRFRGVLMATLDVTGIVPLLASANPSSAITLFDDQRRVIVSSLPDLAPGVDLQARVPAGTELTPPGGAFKYSPTRPDPASRFVPDLRHAAYTVIGPLGWGVMVDRLSTSLHDALLPVVIRILATLLLLVLLMGLAVGRISRDLADPLLSVAREARRIAAAESADGPELDALRRSPAAEVRDLGLDFERMAEALAEQRSRNRARVGEIEHRFEAAFQNAAHGQIHADLLGTVLRVNDRAVEILGLDREALGRLPFGIPHLTESTGALTVDIEPLRRGEANAVVSEGTVRRGAEQATVRAIATLARQDSGDPPFVVIAIEDLSAQRDLERRLAESQRLEAIGLLAGGVAHDFNNLLTPIMGYAELARDDLPADSAARRDLGSVLKAARRARDLVRQLLAFGRRQTLELERVDPGRLLEDFRTLLAPVVPPAIRLEFTAEPGLGPVEIDAAQIEQVLMNLSVNAIDAMPDGGVLSVAIRSEEITPASNGGPRLPPGRYVAFDVRDTGAGIGPGAVEKVFEPFFTTKEPGKGTGLGLAMAHGIVAQHRGAVRVASAPGRGSTFTVLLPRAPDRPEPESPGGVGEGTVLVAEDEAGVRNLVTAVLARRGYQVLSAASGEEAMALATQHPGPIWLLVTDLVMPGISGRQLYNRLAMMRPGIRALFISGFGIEELGEPGLLDGTAGFLQKPFSPEELLTRVSDVGRGTAAG